MIKWNGPQIDYLLVDDFRFKDRFIDLSETVLSQALQMVNAQFSGVYRLWAILPPNEKRAKRELCINYLIAWQLAFSHPELAIGVQGTGALPLSQKVVGPVSLSYRNLLRQTDGGTLDMLTTNEFGLQALQMLQTAPENFMVYR